jgi:glycosyltransferase involved in cell wall biosynthesis
VPGEPDVSVLVPVRNEARHLPETVAAMCAQDLGGRTMELVFADGRSEDDTLAVLQAMAAEDPRIRVVDNPDRSTAAGLNAALAHARGRYVARMDAHAYFPERYLASGIERLERGDDVAWVAGPVVPRANGGWSGAVALALGTRLGVGGSRKWQLLGAGVDEEVELDTGVFAGVWARRTVEELGGWDAGWPVNQDSEMAARLLASGRRIVCRAEMAAEYLPRDRVGALARQYWRHGRFRAKTNRRHPGSLRPTHLLPPALLLTGAAAVAAPRPGRELARAALSTYAVAVVVTAASAARHGRRLRDAGGVLVVLPVMHASWGAGFLAGVVRHGLAPAPASSLLRPGPPR